MAIEKKVLKVIFLGKKPVYFDDFLESLDEKIKDGKFFDERFKNFDEIVFDFIPKSRDFSFVSLNKIFINHQLDIKDNEISFNEKLADNSVCFEDIIKINEKMIVIHFGTVPHKILSFVRNDQNIETNFFSVSPNRVKGRKAHQKSGRRVFAYKNNKCQRIFIMHKDNAA